MASILIIRFSALGDVSMTVPVVASFARQYPEHTITVLSSDKLRALFESLPPNCRFIGADLKGAHRGMRGLAALFDELYKQDFDYVADFHDVLRSKFLRFRFWMRGVKTAHIDKGREGKRLLVRRGNKVLVRQRSSFERYKNVLEQLGFPLTLDFLSIFDDASGLTALPEMPSSSSKFRLGIAPFAKHKGKIYPPALMEEVLAHFVMQENYEVFLFGGGPEEMRMFDAWKRKYPALYLPAAGLGLAGELELMHSLDLMISMDSANMHFASLAGIPVLSVWGATHPYAGFMGWNQPLNNAIQVDLSCRPCSIFGNKPCFRKDYACMNLIAPEMIIEKVELMLEEHSAS